MKFYRPLERYNIHEDYLYAEKCQEPKRSILLSALDWTIYMNYDLSLPKKMIEALDQCEEMISHPFGFKDLWETWQWKRWVIEEDAFLISFLRDGMIGKHKGFGRILVSDRVREFYPQMVPSTFAFVIQSSEGEALKHIVHVPRYTRNYGLTQTPLELRVIRGRPNHTASNYQEVKVSAYPHVSQHVMSLDPVDEGKVLENLGFCYRVYI